MKLVRGTSLDRPGGLRALAELLPVPADEDVRLGTCSCMLCNVQVTSSLSDER